MTVEIIGGPADGAKVGHVGLAPRQWALVVGEVIVAMADESEKLVPVLADVPRRYLYQYDRDRSTYVYVGAFTKAGAA